MKRSEEALASANWPKRIDGSEVGVDDLVESVVLHDVSFRSAWRRSCFLFFPLAAAVSLCLLSIFFSSFFCCAFILRRANRQCHATIVTSFVKSSANLEEKVSTYERRTTIGIGKGHRLLLGALGNRDKSDLTVFRNIQQSLALADLLFQRQYAGRGNGQFVEPDIEELFGQGKIRAETGDEARRRYPAYRRWRMRYRWR